MHCQGSAEKAIAVDLTEETSTCIARVLQKKQLQWTSRRTLAHALPGFCRKSNCSGPHGGHWHMHCQGSAEKAIAVDPRVSLTD
ncbi:hypothetical protein SLE2022_086480 [Rubroshorea leprosula]